MFVRFVVLQHDEDSHVEKGVFQAAHELEDHGVLTPQEGALFRETVAWFDRHLEAPDRLSRSRRPGSHANAIAWFKPEAAEHIAKTRALAALLERHGITTKMLTTDRPGYVVYEDHHQLAAVPFHRDTF